MKLAENKATVFDVKKDEKRKNTVQANISTYEGEGPDEERRYSSWFTRFVGKAYEKALGLNDKDKIIIKSAKIENSYNKETEKLYVTVTVFDFKVDD